LTVEVDAVTPYLVDAVKNPRTLRRQLCEIKDVKEL
jgi:hypothetical protein